MNSSFCRLVVLSAVVLTVGVAVAAEPPGPGVAAGGKGRIKLAPRTEDMAVLFEKQLLPELQWTLSPSGGDVPALAGHLAELLQLEPADAAALQEIVRSGQKAVIAESLANATVTPVSTDEIAIVVKAPPATPAAGSALDRMQDGIYELLGARVYAIYEKLGLAAAVGRPLRAGLVPGKVTIARSWNEVRRVTMFSFNRQDAQGNGTGGGRISGRAQLAVTIGPLIELVPPAWLADEAPAAVVAPPARGGFAAAQINPSAPIRVQSLSALVDFLQRGLVVSSYASAPSPRAGQGAAQRPLPAFVVAEDAKLPGKFGELFALDDQELSQLQAALQDARDELQRLTVADPTVTADRANVYTVRASLPAPGRATVQARISDALQRVLGPERYRLFATLNAASPYGMGSPRGSVPLLSNIGPVERTLRVTKSVTAYNFQDSQLGSGTAATRADLRSRVGPLADSLPPEF